MLSVILTAIYFMLPAFIANMFPVFAMKLKLPLGKPIHKRIFGAHKTFRGFYSGYIGALIALALQFYFQSKGIFEDYRLLDYQSINLLLYAFLFGIGAITGDLAKSYFKRRLGKESGSPWLIFDQVDLVLGALAFTYPVYQLEWKYLWPLLVLTPLLHFLTNVIAYKLKLKKVWW